MSPFEYDRSPTGEDSRAPESEFPPVNPPEEPIPAPEYTQAPPTRPQQTTSAPYHGNGAGRKESPYANSPYVMPHQQRQDQYRQPPQNDPYYSNYQQPSHPETPKAPKKKKAAGKFWKRAVAAVLVVALMAGSCAVTAAVVNNRWETRANQMESTFSQQFEDLKKQITSNSASQSVTGLPVVSGDALTPSQVYNSNVDSVVAISSKVRSTMYGQVSESTSAGSGFILSEDGYIVTNSHVVEGATSVTVITHDGTEYPATIEGTDSNNDIAVLKVDATGLPAATIGNSDALVIGDMVVAIGNPLGTLSSTQTVGYVSGKDRDVNTDDSIISMIQTDAAINSGNSGGPLFNMRGEVVGITTAKYSGTTGSGATIEGIGFAIPISDVYGIITDLIDYGYVTGAYMGITVSNTDEQSASMFGLPTGAYVMSVEKDGSADRAGIKAKDIIIDLGGYKVTGITTLTRALRNFKAGDTTTVTLIRGGSQMTLDITLDEKPQTEAAIPENDPEMPSEGNMEEWFEYFRRYNGE